jgi:ATP/maltotriose-dependent transcriptional regulator MalT
MIRPVAADGRIETGGAFTPIHRPRVVERIQSAAMQRIVLIIAPAGYGKSVALRQYLETLTEEAVRFDVHAEHATLLGFVRGFADALRDVAPDARKTLSGAYEKSQSSKTPGVDLAMWMHAHIKTFTGVIAIDDLHIAETNPEISKFLSSLIDRTKGRARWVIASRSTLDLPVGSWLAYGEMDLNIDEQDLKFTLDEARQTAKASRVVVRDEELNEILAMTEGWPTALSFAVRTSTRSVDFRNIAATTREMVYRYLAEQVYESLDDEERELLHFVAYLPEIDLEVLRRAGYAKGKAVVERLRDRVAFIYPDRPNVYRCHDLFRAFLQHQLELSGDAAVIEMQHRVAAALEEAEDVPAALELYAAIPSEQNMLRLLEQHGLSLTEQGHADTVWLAVDALSQEMRAVHPIVLALRGMREAHNGRFDRAESLLQRAMQRAADRVEMRGELAARLGGILFNQGRYTDVIELYEPLMNEPLPQLTYAKLLSLITPAYAYAGKTDRARSALMTSQEYAATIESEEIRARMLYRMGLTAVSLSLPFQQVDELFSRAHALANEHALFTTSAAALGGLANVCLAYEDDITRYVWYAQQALNAAAKAGDRFALQTALLQVITAEARRGNFERLTALEQQFASATTSDTARLIYIVPSRAMVSAARGNFDEAYRQLSTVADRKFYDFADKIFNTALQGLYAAAAGLRERATTLAENVITELGCHEFHHLYGQRLAEISRLLSAVTEAISGRGSSAQRILARKALVEGPPVSAIKEAAIGVCRALKKPALADDAFEQLAQLHAVGYGGLARVMEAALKRALDESRQSDAGLTRGEIAVLQSLAQGLGPKDIARETGRSVYTIQAHIQNVIRKLGCSGRHEALTVARKRGLVG